MIQVLKSKLHRVKVTDANLNYIGSITIDEDLLDAANMIAGEKVQYSQKIIRSSDNNSPANTIYLFYKTILSRLFKAI